jgi:hypothetical protein
MPLCFHPAMVEISLAHAIEQVEALLHRCLWVIGPSPQPPGLQQRFIALGFTVRMEWEGLTGKNRLRRVMHTYGIAARRLPQEIYAPWQSNRYHVRAELVTDATPTMAFEVPGSIWHSEQGKHYGAVQTHSLLLQKGFVLSMSRDGTPQSMATLKALSASSTWLELHVAPIIRWGSFYEQRRPGSTFTIWSDHMRRWITPPRSNLLSNTSWSIFLHSPYCDVYFSRGWAHQASCLGRAKSRHLRNHIITCGPSEFIACCLAKLPTYRF